MRNHRSPCTRNRASCLIQCFFLSYLMTTSWGIAKSAAHTISRSHDTDTISFLFNSTAPFGAVHIPFTLDHGMIIVRARVDGKPLACIVDTGCCNALQWSASQHVVGRDLGRHTDVYDAYGAKRTCRVVLVSTVTLGGYELRNVAGLEIAPPASKSAAPALIDRLSVLGTAAFAHTVMMIDYQKQEILLRRPEYDFQHRARHKTDRVYPFTLLHFANPAIPASANFGFLILTWKADKRPINMEIDTGWTTQEIGLSAGYLAVHPSAFGLSAPGGISPKTKMYFLYTGVSEVDYVPDMTFFFDGSPPIEVHRPAMVMPSSDEGVDGIFRYDILQHFRMTLDYERRVVLLEPYQPTFAQTLSTQVAHRAFSYGDVNFNLSHVNTFNVNSDGSVTIATCKSAGAPAP